MNCICLWETTQKWRITEWNIWKNARKKSNFLWSLQWIHGYFFWKGSRKKSAKPPAESKCWYISHHGVYNGNKLNKIRVVFKRSAEYKDASLNNKLMSETDLTKQIVGILMKVWQEPTAVMADIESMFFQVWVLEEHQNFSRLLR